MNNYFTSILTPNSKSFKKKSIINISRHNHGIIMDKILAKNEDVTYTRIYQEAQKDNANRHNNGKDVEAINSPIEAHPREISSAFSSKKLSAKQKNVLDKLPYYGSSASFKKRDVSMIDLSALTAETGDEFALFTR